MGDEFLQLEKYVNLNYMGFHKVGWDAGSGGSVLEKCVNLNHMGFHKVGAGAVGWRTAGGGLCCNEFVDLNHMGFHKVGAGAVGWRTAGGGLCCDEFVDLNYMGFHKVGWDWWQRRVCAGRWRLWGCAGGGRQHGLRGAPQGGCWAVGAEPSDLLRRVRRTCVGRGACRLLSSHAAPAGRALPASARAAQLPPVPIHPSIHQTRRS